MLILNKTFDSLLTEMYTGRQSVTALLQRRDLSLKTSILIKWV